MPDNADNAPGTTNTNIAGNQNTANIGGDLEGDLVTGTKNDNRTTTNIYEAPKKPTTANNVPTASLTTSFTGRDAELAALKQGFDRTGVQVVQGIGGVGKTQLALQFVLDNTASYPICWWINADTTTAIESDLTGLAVALQLATPDTKPDIKLDLLLAYLQTYDGWLLVFNNADNPADLAPYRQFMTASGKVLLTSRVLDWAHIKVLKLKPFPPEIGSQFLLERTGQSGTAAEAAALELTGKEVLAGLPLALEQAAAYCVATGTPLPTALQLFKTSLLKMLEKLDKKLPKENASIAAIVAVATEKLKTENETTALHLLELLALLAPEPFPLDALASLFPDDLEFADARAALQKYALAEFSVVDATSTVTSHRLTQAVVRATISGENTQILLEHLVDALNTWFNADKPQDHRYWSRYAAVLPHFQQLDTTGLNTPAIAYLLNHFGLYLEAIGNYKEALPLYLRALQIDEAVNGASHPDTATSLNNLAGLYISMGNYSEAMPLFKRALQIREQELGASHPSTATSLNNLGLLYKSMGNYGEALPLYQRALAIQEQALPGNHPNTVTLRGNIASLEAKMKKQP